VALDVASNGVAILCCKLQNIFKILCVVIVCILNAPQEKQGVALPFTLKILLIKEELWKFKYFTMQKYSLQKNPLKETKILQDIILTLHN
jgi:hypothetical protein